MEENNNEREAFEAYVTTMAGYPFAGAYLNLMWKTWQTRAALAQIGHSEAARQMVPSAYGWLQSGGLLYRVTDERRPQNRDEINVTMAEGSRKADDLVARAAQILALLTADHSEDARQMVPSASAQTAAVTRESALRAISYVELYNGAGRADDARSMLAGASPAALTDALIEHEAGVFSHYNGEMGQWVFDEYRLLEFARSVIGLAAQPADHSGDSADMVAEPVKDAKENSNG